MTKKKKTNRSDNMRDKISLAMKSCKPDSPSHSARLLKIQAGELIGYGGTFCIKIPCNVDVECAFNPEAVVTFFRKDRTGVAYTVTNANRLVLRHKRERVTVPCFDGSEMPIIDVFKEPKPIKRFINKNAAKALLECVRPDHANAALQGVCFRKGLAIATDRRVVLAMVSGLPKSISCVLPIDTVKFLTTLDEDPVSVAFDGSHLKLVFEDGMSVCSRTISSLDYPDVSSVISPSGGTTIKLHPDLLSELKGIKSDVVTATEKSVSYRTEKGDSFGEIELPTEGKFAFSVNKRLFDLMLSLTLDDTITITSTPHAVHANGKKYFRMTLAQMTQR